MGSIGDVGPTVTFRSLPIFGRLGPVNKRTRKIRGSHI
jgi:hypothetical protein